MFIPQKYDAAEAQPWELLPAAAGSYQVGQLLTVSAGKLAAISAASATTPAYLCMATKQAAAGENVPVTRVKKGVIYETTLSKAASGGAIGSMLEVSAGGLEADNTAAGTFEVVYLEGTTQGSIVRGRFV